MKAKKISNIIMVFGFLCFLIGMGALMLGGGKISRVICYCGIFAYAICSTFALIAWRKSPAQTSDPDATNEPTEPNNNNSEIN